MGHDRDRDADLRTGHPFTLTRRTLLHSALAAGGFAAMGTRSTVMASARQENRQSASPSVALQMARLHNRPQFGDLPPKAIDHAKILLASTVAAAAYGSIYPSSRVIRDLAKELGGKPQATIWFDGMKLPMPEAARVNSVLSNAAAGDDTDIDSSTHPGPELIPTGLVVAEGMGSSGQDLLAAIVTGFEAQNRMGAALKGGRGGMYASQTVAFGAVVMAARLLKLTDEQLAHALGITAMTMGGLAIGTDSWARDYGGSNAAVCAVNAALAAGRGFIVNEDMLEARGGFVEVFGAGKTDSLTAPIKEWGLAKYLSIKLNPGVWTYSVPLEATLVAVKKGNVSPDDVAKILVSNQRMRTINGSRRPKTFHDAIHSLPYFLASAVVDRDFTWVHATQEKINNPVVARLMPLVEVDPSPSTVRYDWPWGSTVTIVTKSGAKYSGTVDAMKGSAPRGIEWSDIDAKYRALIPNAKLPGKRSEDALNMIHHFEQVKNVSELIRMLVPG